VHHSRSEVSSSILDLHHYHRCLRLAATCSAFVLSAPCATELTFIFPSAQSICGLTFLSYRSPRTTFSGPRSIIKNSSHSSTSPIWSYKQAEWVIPPARFYDPSMLKSGILRWRRWARIRCSFMNLLLIKRVVAPQSTIAATDALWFQPLRVIWILKCKLDSVNSEMVQELILSQRFGFIVRFGLFSTAHILSGDIMAACMYAHFKNLVGSGPLSEQPRPFAARLTGWELLK